MTIYADTEPCPSAEKWYAKWEPTAISPDVRHVESRTCRCSIQGLEPHENCPVHGVGMWPPKCQWCGKIIKRARREMNQP